MPQSEYFDYPETTCPKCHRSVNALLIDPQAPHDRPKLEDLTICFYCGSILIFREDFRLDLPTLTERLAIAEDPALSDALSYAQKKVFMQMHARGPKH